MFQAGVQKSYGLILSDNCDNVKNSMKFPNLLLKNKTFYRNHVERLVMLLCYAASKDKIFFPALFKIEQNHCFNASSIPSPSTFFRNNSFTQFIPNCIYCMVSQKYAMLPQFYSSRKSVSPSSRISLLTDSANSFSSSTDISRSQSSSASSVISILPLILSTDDYSRF